MDEDGTWAAATSLVGPSSTFAAISSFALYALWITTHCIALDNTCSTQCALVLVSLPPTPNTPLHVCLLCNLKGVVAVPVHLSLPEAMVCSRESWERGPSCLC